MMRPSGPNELARLLGSCPRLTLRARDVRGAEDFPDAAMLIVERGIVALASGARAKRRIVLTFCSRGMVLPPPRQGEQLAALTDSAVRSVTPDVLRRLLQRPVTAEVIVDALLEALFERQESLAQFANVMHAERLREKLLQLARSHGTAVPDGVRVELPLTHALLGQAVGSSRETVTSMLRTLEQDGFLVREGRLYRLRISSQALESRTFAPIRTASPRVNRIADSRR